MLLTDVVKLARVFLVMLAINNSSERAFSVMKRIKTYLHSSTTNNRLNYCVILHIRAEDVDKINTIEIAMEFIEYYQTRLPYSADFKYLSAVIEQYCYISLLGPFN